MTTTYEIDVNEEVNDWLHKQALMHNCSVEDYAGFVLLSVCVNHHFNQQKNEKTLQPETV